MDGDQRAAAEAPADADVSPDISRRYPLEYNFRFAYDSRRFSDRRLRLVVVPGDEFPGFFNLPRDRFRFFGDAHGGGAEQKCADLAQIADQDKEVQGSRLLKEVMMPRLSYEMTKANIVKWVKKEGEQFSPGEVLLVLETDEGTLEFKATEEGYIAKIHQGDGAKEIKVGEIICVTVEDEGDIEQLKDYKPCSRFDENYEEDNNVPLSTSKCLTPKADIEDYLGDVEKTSESSQVKRVRDVFINSAIVAAHSSVFLKILNELHSSQRFSSGMRESIEDLVTYEISESEENMMLEVLGFLYSGTLSTVHPPLLLDIMMLADWFGILPLMKHCTQLLMSMHMTEEYALVYLDYPYSSAVAEEVSCLLESAAEFLLSKYQNLTKIPCDFYDMPLIGIEVIFGSSQVRVDSEDAVYDFLGKWAYQHYPDPEERLFVCRSRLVPLVRFCHMSHAKLLEIVSANGNGLHCEETLKHIADALLGCKATCGLVPQRDYCHKPIKAVEFDDGCPQTILFFNITRDECRGLFPDGKVYSHPFTLAAQQFHLSACCEKDDDSGVHYFGLWVGSPGASELVVDLKFAVRDRAGKFVFKFQEMGVLIGEERRGTSDLFDLPWAMFLADEDLYIDGVLHLRVDLTAAD